MDDVMMFEVYARADDDGRVIGIDGGVTIENVDTQTWVKIDEGSDRKRHGGCQQHYLDMPIFTEDGVPRYKLVGGSVVLRDADEVEADRAEVSAVRSPLELMQEQLDDITLLMAEMIGGMEE